MATTAPTNDQSANAKSVDALLWWDSFTGLLTELEHLSFSSDFPPSMVITLISLQISPLYMCIVLFLWIVVMCCCSSRWRSLKIITSGFWAPFLSSCPQVRNHARLWIHTKSTSVRISWLWSLSWKMRLWKLVLLW